MPANPEPVSDSRQKRGANVRTRAATSENGADVDAAARPLGWGWVLSKVLVGSCLVLGFGLGTALLVHRFLLTSPRFAIERVHAVGSRHFSEEQLLSLAGAKRGQNLFALDVAQAERNLAATPWIQEAQVTRKLPSTLSISVREYLPAALAALDGSLYLVTREGRPIKAVAPEDEVDFPIITGLGAVDVSTDRERATERLAQALDVQREYERLPLSRTYPTEEIHLTSDGRLDLVIGPKGLTLRLGKGPFRQKLLMAGRVIGNLQNRGQVPALVFLDNAAHPERVVARMR